MLLSKFGEGKKNSPSFMRGSVNKEQVETVKTASILRRLVGNMSKATTVKEAALAVLAASDEETKQ